MVLLVLLPWVSALLVAHVMGVSMHAFPLAELIA